MARTARLILFLISFQKGIRPELTAIKTYVDKCSARAGLGALYISVRLLFTCTSVTFACGLELVQA